MAEIKLNSPLQYIKGVGPKKAEALEKMGYNKVADLLSLFPRKYLDRTNVVPIRELRINQPATIIGRVVSHGLLHGRKRRYEVILQDESGAISLLWFQGIKFWQRLFKRDQVFACSGRATAFQGLQMIHPDLERLDDESDKMIHAGRIIPVYPQTAELNKVGLNSKSMRRVTNFIYDNLTEEMIDYLPKAIVKNENLLSLHEAVKNLHFPDNREDVERARKRLAFDELLAFQYLVFKSKENKEKISKKHSYQAKDDKMKSFRSNLPFSLTGGQDTALTDIIGDLNSDKPMHRMLQGDVGCGKTVVAVMASLYAALNGFQAAFMAPTEILAEQHFRNWEKPLAEIGIKAGLLTASLKAAEKRKVAELCEAGEIDILFGTHALIYDYVSFERLGLVIIDEQHRFGVKQRGKLYEKGDNPDLLVMTATPIPRSLALTLYGDLDISTIKSLPKGRKPIKTVWRTQSALPKIYKYLVDEVKKGGQVYMVYPLIEKSEMIELENVEDAFEELSKTVFRNIKSAMIHGRVKAKERDEKLKAFFNGDIDILFATTVIEVGLDNPNATIMLIEHAERFGLAQLHQLRGRIGRGQKQATMIAVAHPPLTEIAEKRLEYFVDNLDGFKIAEADLELRGPGEIFGVRQSGLPEFQSVRLGEDSDLIEITRKILHQLFTNQSLTDGNKRLLSYLKLKTEDKSISLSG